MVKVFRGPRSMSQKYVYLKNQFYMLVIFNVGKNKKTSTQLF